MLIEIGGEIIAADFVGVIPNCNTVGQSFPYRIERVVSGEIVGQPHVSRLPIRKVIARCEIRFIVQFVACDPVAQHVVTRRRYRAVVFGDDFNGQCVKPCSLFEIVTAIRAHRLRGVVEQVAPCGVNVGTRVYHDTFRIVYTLIT